MGREVYKINGDGTISRTEHDSSDNAPWFVSLTSAAAHSFAQVNCFTKEGIRSQPFVNPHPDPDIDVSEEPERHHYYVQMTSDGELHIPPLTPDQARDHEPIFEQTDDFEYEADNLIPDF